MSFLLVLHCDAFTQCRKASLITGCPPQIPKVPIDLEAKQTNSKTCVLGGPPKLHGSIFSCKLKIERILINARH